jgi:hypothetical protein
MSTPVEGAQISEDGNYWWDGNEWKLVEKEPTGDSADPANAASEQPPDGPYHPTTHGAFDPNTHGEFDPNVHGNYHPEVHGEYDPARHGPYDRGRHGDFHPQIHGDFDANRHGEFDPAQHGDFHPGLHGEYHPARHGEFHQHRHGPHHPDLHGPHDPAVHGELSAERHGEAAAAAHQAANAIEWGSYPTIHALVSTHSFEDFMTAANVPFTEEMRDWDNTTFSHAAMAVESAQAAVGNAPAESMDRQQLRAALDAANVGSHVEAYGDAVIAGGHQDKGEALKVLGQTLTFEASVL